MRPREGHRRVVITAVQPELEGGRFAIKRVVGEEVAVEADVFADGHDHLAGVLRYRHETEPTWAEVPLTFLDNDRWRAVFTVTRLGGYRYTLSAWVDHFTSWLADLVKWVQAGQEVNRSLRVGAAIISATARRARGEEGARLREIAASLRAGGDDAVARAQDPALAALAARYPDRAHAATYERELAVTVDRARAGFGAWYELFPRSWSGRPGVHATFRDVIANAVPYVASMDFDVLYLPPVHPIATTGRKGRNNVTDAGPTDPGSPWAIGSSEGGHDAVHPALGTLEDFDLLVARARAAGLEIALDLAFQCSPDHPYVREHPEWFRRRPDGGIQYAENPPKKYQDIYPLNFETPRWKELWEELLRVVRFWIEHGVRIFRVDNPHTKPFAFWEWLIGEIRRDHPDVVFLSEAFTRPKVMHRLAKLGFTQSYTYFAWRNTRAELTDYFTELTRTEVVEYFRPNLWPNTPDILTAYLQEGGRSAFMVRFVLAATLGASYGIYGPAFELGERVPLAPGSEEYLNSEKYELRTWDLDRPDSLRDLITRVNSIRRDNPALREMRTLRFHPVDNDQLIAYSKHDPGMGNLILTVVNLDPRHPQSGWLDLPPALTGSAASYGVRDLLTGARYEWHGSRNFVLLDPGRLPAHIFRVERVAR
jgi:starch synthase (maltosyl-transferring)